MRIGVVSDTHNHLPNVRRIVELFNRVAVERVVHTGDITQVKTLETLSQLDAPLFGVYGNNDVETELLDEACEQFGFTFACPPVELAWANRRILVVHDPREMFDHIGSHHDVVLHGHNHRHVHETIEGTLVFNPGESAGHMPGYNAVGIVDLVDLATEIVRF